MTNRHPCDVYRVARQCGVVLRDSFEHSPTSRKPKECFCKPTLRKIGRQYGEDHLRLVLQLMMGTQENSRELYADIVKAASSILINHPEIEKAVNLTAIFDKMDLGEIRRKSKDIKGMPRWHAAYVLMYVFFRLEMKTEPTFWDTQELAYG